MFKYIVKRILLAVLILLGVAFITYVLLRLMPSDYIDNMYASQISLGNITQEQVNEIKAIYGLLDNSFLGIVKGFLGWIKNLAKFNLGISFKYRQPVSTLIADNMWVSFWLSLFAFVLQMIISIPLGITCAVHQYSKRDYALTVVTMMLISLPSFFLSALLIKVFAIDLGWFPSYGLVDASNPSTGIMLFLEKIYHLIIPMLTVLLLSIGGFMRYMRTNTLEVLGSDYIRTARAKGLREGKVIYKHAFRNTLIPIVTMMAGVLPGLFGGMMIVETVFAIPGIGSMAYKAMIEGDIPFIMGYNMFLAVLTVIGTILSDLMYVAVDPRVKLA